MNRNLSLEQLRQQLDETIDGVRHGGDQVVVEQNGVAVAAVVPIQQYEALQQARDQLWTLIDRARAENVAAEPTEIEAAVEQAVREVRAAGREFSDHRCGSR